jgi:succinate dehydrogenase/fumarate reductase flavoprotein subunit
VASCDAIVVGGGPAGSTVSFTIAKTPQFWKLVTQMTLGEYGRR